MIEVNVTKKLKTFQGREALHIKTSFAAQQITGIYGPSGAGKTTFLKILAGLIQPEKGNIKAGEEIWLDTDQQINWPPQKRKVGFVFQEYALFPNMTVEQHLHYGTKDEIYVQQLLHMGQMHHFSKHKPKQLSGGQQQRLAILRALAPKPTLLLMDEPFSALDTILKNSLMENLKALLLNMQMTCLIVTHYPFEISNFADQGFEFATHEVN